MSQDLFDSTGDELLANAQSQPELEPINSSSEWPHLIYNPNFKGSRVIVVTEADNEDENVTLEAFVKGIGTDSQNEMAIIFQEARDVVEGTIYDELTIAYKSIKSVTMCIDPSENKENEYREGLSKSSLSSLSFHCALSDEEFNPSERMEVIEQRGENNEQRGQTPY